MMLALLLGALVLGWFARRYTSLPADAPMALNTYIINIALPAMILLKVPLLQLNAEALVPVISALIVILGSAALVLLLARRLQWSPEILGASLLVVPLSNSAYLGLPLLDALRGAEVVAYGALYDQFGNFLALAIYAPFVIALIGTGEQGIGVKQVLFRLITFVPFPALMLALFVLTPETIPDAVVPALTFLSKTMAPIAAFIVGFALRFAVPLTLIQPLVIGMSIRLLIAPVAVWFVTDALGVGGSAQIASVLQAGMPCMITAGLMGIAAGFSERLIVAMLAYSTLFGIFSVMVLNTLL